MKPFKQIAGLKPGRSVFDNSYYKVFDCNLGWLIPVLCDLYLPGDVVKIAVEALVRANPLIMPLMHRIDMKVDYFAVPIRLLWPKPDYKDEEGNTLGYTLDTSSFEEFITGGVTGKLAPVQPKWIPVDSGLYSLWDYFGNPLGKYPVGGINAYQKRAYQMVYNEYYRDPDMEDPVDLDSENLRLRKWEKDYFTSARPELQRGVAPSVPLSGTGKALFDGSIDTVAGGNYGIGMSSNLSDLKSANAGGAVAFKDWLEKNQIDLTNVGTMTANDMRTVFQIQKYLERSMRAGSRLTEQILAHWGVHNGDSRLQRPEYIGGSRSPIIISEVLQTSQTTTDQSGGSPQGNLSGHGIGTANTTIGSYYCREHTVIIGLMSLMPKPVYQQGVNRQWLYETKFDYPTPELVNLGEQEVYNMELMCTGNEPYDKGVFGYQGRYDEHRVKQNQICGRLRSQAQQSLSQWHLARYFDPASPPVLNEEFLEMVDDQRYSAVQGSPTGPIPGWIVTFGNRVRRIAPLPIVGTPGLIDHH